MAVYACRPANFKVLLDWTQIVELDIVSFPTVSCIYVNPSFYVVLRGYVLAPVAIALIMVIAWQTGACT